MLPFCGYNMGDYFAHWLRTGARTDSDKLPMLFWVNWFRRDADGSFLWPGFGENSRVLKWIVERLNGGRLARSRPRSASCRPPTPSTPPVSTSTRATMAKLLEVDVDAWRQEVPLIEDHYAGLGERLPAELKEELRDAGEAARQLNRERSERAGRPSERQLAGRRWVWGAAPPGE